MEVINVYNLVIKRRKPSKLNIEEYDTEIITFAKKEVAKEYQTIYNADSDVVVAYIIDLETGNHV